MEKKNIDSKQMFKVFMKKKKVVYSITSGCLFIACGILFMTVDPLSIVSRYFTRLNEGSFLYSTLEEKMEGVSIEIYLWNITNAESFIDGTDTNLKLQEVGPFVYRQVRQHKNLSIDDEEHILRYTPSASNTFDPEASVGNPTTTRLFLPNIPLLLFSSKVADQNYFVKLPFNLATANARSKPILNITVQEYLWGYEDPLVSFAHNMLPGVFHFGKLGLLDRFFDPKNNRPLELDATDDKRFQITKMDGLEGLPGLGYESKRSTCNTFNNTYEGIMFPYKMSYQRNVRLYHNIYCRILDLEPFRNETMEYGSEAYVYRIKKTAFEHTPENECICPSGKCLDGLSDLSPCFFGLPLSLSLAHFLDADKQVFNRIEGLKPNESLHGSEFHIDKETGIALASRFTIQYNLMIGDVRFNSAAKPFSNMVVPFIWINVVQPPLPSDVLLKLRLLNIYAPQALLVTELLLFAIGIGLIIYASIHLNNLPKRQHARGYFISAHEKKPAAMSLLGLEVL